MSTAEVTTENIQNVTYAEAVSRGRQLEESNTSPSSSTLPDESKESEPLQEDEGENNPPEQTLLEGPDLRASTQRPEDHQKRPRKIISEDSDTGARAPSSSPAGVGLEAEDQIATESVSQRPDPGSPLPEPKAASSEKEYPSPVFHRISRSSSSVGQKKSSEHRHVSDPSSIRGCWNTCVLY